jgi:hypothetical protein
VKRAADRAKGNRGLEAETRSSKWMSGAEALEYLADIEEEPQDRFRLLHSRIRDGDILGRARGRERERYLFLSQGLCLDPDYAPQIDDTWRLKFILSESVNLSEFCEQSELLREDVLNCLAPKKGRNAHNLKRPTSATWVKAFVANFIKTEKDAGRIPTSAGVEKAGVSERRGARKLLRDQFIRQQNDAGIEVRRGRPPKTRP